MTQNQFPAYIARDLEKRINFMEQFAEYVVVLG